MKILYHNSLDIGQHFALRVAKKIPYLKISTIDFKRISKRHDFYRAIIIPMINKKCKQ
jgi:hypothetical protein